MANRLLRLALAVVVLHAGKAFAAASIASFVSDMPSSGIVPSTSFVAGSIDLVRLTSLRKGAEH